MTTLTGSHTAPELAVLPARTVLAVDGAGAPGGPAFAAAVDALYAALGGDAPLEGTWWSGEDRLAFAIDRPEAWRWTLAVPAPGRTAAPDPATGVRVEHRPATRVARLVHHGPHEEEGPSLAALAAFVAARGAVAADAHTETYLNDPRTTAPGDLRTELRVPVR